MKNKAKKKDLENIVNIEKFERPEVDFGDSISLEDYNKIHDTLNKKVNHPAHYQSKSGIEAIDVIEAFDLGFCLGNVVKYICRCGKKDDEIQELEKAKWYLEREIANRKNKSISFQKGKCTLPITNSLILEDKTFKDDKHQI